MKDKPIIFSTAMVQAILAGCKTQTRRTIKFPKLGWDEIVSGECLHITKFEKEILVKFYCRYPVGTKLWVRETWRPILDGYQYKASYPNKEGQADKQGWKPSIHMPKEAARLWLEVTNVRVERLQDISEKDAIAEGVATHRVRGITCPLYLDYLYPNQVGFSLATNSYHTLWESIHGDNSWALNPWVWAIDFKQIEKP